MKAKITQHNAVFTLKNFIAALKQTKNALFDGTPAQLAAGVAYFGTLSFFPLVAALVAIAGLTLDKSQLVTIVNGLATYMPKDIASLLSTQLQNASMHQQANFLIMIFALGLAIFGVSGVIESVTKAIATIYNVKDTRSFIRQKLVIVGLTVGFIVGMALVLPLLFIGENLLILWGVPAGVISAFSVVRWLILLVVAMIELGVVYHFALPDRTALRWFGWGSIIATVLWLAISAALYIYLQYFANFSNSYSLFAGIIALMIWINFSALAVLVGAYVNREFER